MAGEGHWPLAAIDFEASSLSRGSYPVEVGLATWKDWDEPIVEWSSLVRPTAEWLESGHWDPASERVHGIRRADLEGGMPARDAAERVLDLVGSLGVASPEVACDGLSHDRAWWSMLLAQTSRAGGFRIVSHARLLRLGGDVAARAREGAVTAHRAGPDALALLSTCAEGMGFSPRVVRLPSGRDSG